MRGSGINAAIRHNNEVGIVCLGPKQMAVWAMEVKWSIRYTDHPRELSSRLRFSHVQNLTRAMVTTRTTRGARTIEGVAFELLPASLYCCMPGFNLVHERYLLEGLIPATPAKAK